jgi:hypothetical protein
MRIALTAFLSAASLCALATAASAQTVYYDTGAAPTIPSNTGAPLYSYHRTGAQPGVVGSCSIISGNRVCSAMPADDGSSAGYAYGGGGPVGALIGAPMMVLTAPFGGPGYAYGGSGATYAPATGTPAYSYKSQVGPQRGMFGHCRIFSGNRVCSTP